MSVVKSQLSLRNTENNSVKKAKDELGNIESKVIYQGNKYSSCFFDTDILIIDKA